MQRLWADNISHGKPGRFANDATLTIDCGNFQFVFQGMFKKQETGKGDGEYPWRIGMQDRSTPGRASCLSPTKRDGR